MVSMEAIEISARTCQSEQTVKHISSHKSHVFSPCENAGCLSRPAVRLRSRTSSRLFTLDACSYDVITASPPAFHPEENGRGGVFCSSIGLHTRHHINRLDNRLGPVRCPKFEGYIGLVIRYQNPVENRACFTAADLKNGGPRLLSCDHGGCVRLASLG